MPTGQEKKILPRQAGLGFLLIATSLGSLITSVAHGEQPTNSGNGSGIDVVISLNGLCERLVEPNRKGVVSDETLDLNCGNTDS